MELTLNLVWLCVAIAGILVQAVMLARTGSAKRQPSPARKIIAMGCALVILFFVISMTDDLHDQALFFEESKLSRIAPGARVSNHTASNRLFLSDFPLFVVARPCSPTLSDAGKLAPPAEFQFVPAAERHTVSGRAPPPFLT
jgi:hypothetical protein